MVPTKNSVLRRTHYRVRPSVSLSATMINSSSHLAAQDPPESSHRVDPPTGFLVGEEAPKYGRDADSDTQTAATELQADVDAQANTGSQVSGAQDPGVQETEPQPTPSQPTPPQPTPSSSSVLELDAVELHRRIIGFQRLTEKARVEFLKLLAVFDSGQRFSDLGYVNTRQYLMREFNMPRSTALENVRAARALGKLPKLSEAFGSGEISWSAFKSVSRVATEETEQQWVDLARDEPYAHTRQQVEQALARGREEPAATSDYGLSNLRSVVSCEMTLEQKEKLQTAMARVAEEMGEGAPTDLASVLIYLSQKILNGEPVSTGDAHASKTHAPTSAGGASGLVVVYRQCPNCAGSTVDTEAGRVQVAPEIVDRIADIAQVTHLTPQDLEESEPLPEGEIDPPNSSAFARKIRHRDGLRCANPCCEQRRGLQAHHIKFRSHGGRTELSNEVAVCRPCHTLVHSGVVKIEKSPNSTDELVWIPQVKQLGELEPFDPFPSIAELQRSMAATQGDVNAAAAARNGLEAASQETSTGSSPEAPLSEHAFPQIDFAGLIRGIQSVGHNKASAEARFNTALERLSERMKPEQITEEDCLREALRG